MFIWHDAKGNAFLEMFLTGDEIWVHCYLLRQQVTMVSTILHEVQNLVIDQKVYEERVFIYKRNNFGNMRNPITNTVPGIEKS